jgi:hypothetical protein
MSKTLLFAGAVLVALLACSAGQAQMRGSGLPGVSVPARVAPMRVTSAARVSAVRSTSGAQANRQATVIQISPNGRVISGAGTLANSVSFDEENGVPGLGFDFVHLAAISGNFRNNPPNFGRRERREHNFVTPIFFGGFPYYSDSSDYQQVQQQPQIIVIQQPAPAVTVQQAAPAPQEFNAAPVIPAAAATPVREVGEFVLVRRDGRILFASAFSVVGPQLQYVTPEGIRRTLPLTELDAVATQEMNEARGTAVQLHN